MKVYTSEHVRSAILLVAGRGRRLGPLTERQPKCLIEVAGAPILHRTLEGLARVGIEHVTLVVGYRQDDVRASVGAQYAGMSVSYVHNDRHERTNTAYSLWLAREALDSRVMLLEGDIVCEAETLQRVLESAGSTSSAWAGIPIAPGRDEGILLAPADGCVREVQLVRDPTARPPRFKYKCAGIQVLDRALGAAFRCELDREVAFGRLNTFADLVLGRTFAGHDVRLCSLQGYGWAEVDDADDLRLADQMFDGRRTAPRVAIHEIAT